MLIIPFFVVFYSSQKTNFVKYRREFLKKQQSFLKTASLGLQHLLAMYSGDILVPILVGGALGFNAKQMTYLISADIFMCGIATLIQIKRTPLTGIGLPVVLGCAVEYVAPLQQIGKKLGPSYMYGGIIAAGIFILLISYFFAKMRRFFPPIVTGSLITLVGFTLIPVAFQNIGGGNSNAKNFGEPVNLLLGLITALAIICLNVWGKGFIQQIAVLIGIITGTIVAVAFNQVNFSSVHAANWFQVPQLFYFAAPKFEWSSIATMILAAFTCMIESTGVYFALGEVVKQDLSEKDLAAGYRSEGLAAILGGLFNTFPYSTFSQNVGIVQLSGIKTLNPVYYSAFFLIILGMIPKVGAIANLIPPAVLGGAMLVMFGMVGAQGIKILSQVKMTTKNLLIMAISIGLGLGVTAQPQLFQFLPTTIQTIFSNGMVIGSITAIILNILLNGSQTNK